MSGAHMLVVEHTCGWKTWRKNQVRESTSPILIKEMGPEAFGGGGSNDEKSQEVYRGDPPQGVSRGISGETGLMR